MMMVSFSDRSRGRWALISSGAQYYVMLTLAIYI